MRENASNSNKTELTKETKDKLFDKFIERLKGHGQAIEKFFLKDSSQGAEGSVRVLDAAVRVYCIKLKMVNQAMAEQPQNSLQLDSQSTVSQSSTTNNNNIVAADLPNMLEQLTESRQKLLVAIKEVNSVEVETAVANFLSRQAGKHTFFEPDKPQFEFAKRLQAVKRGLKKADEVQAETAINTVSSASSPGTC